MQASTPVHDTERRARVLLAAGALAGLSLTAYGLLAGSAPGTDPVPADAIALVNEEPIARDAYLRLAERLESERGEPLGLAERRRLLDRLIEETLLVQRGLSLGLVRHDPSVRKGLSAAVIQSVTAEAAAAEFEDSAVEEFYAAHGDYFAAPGRLHVRELRVPISGDGEAESRARAARATERLRAGDEFGRVEAELGSPSPARPPEIALPARTLGEYLGPTLLERAEQMREGEVSEPIRIGDAFHVLVIVARQAERSPPLPEIETLVRAEMRRRAGDQALRVYLDELRAASAVRIAEDRL